jgi:hypothetical protein
MSAFGGKADVAERTSKFAAPAVVDPQGHDGDDLFRRQEKTASRPPDNSIARGSCLCRTPVIGFFLIV